tara:strand:- start:63 stop:1577 length:1515 start_codon:yes stop_codon:yes gene_type:complete
LATPPDGTKLSLGKLGRATNVGNSDNTSRTSLNSAGRDSGTSRTKLSDFFIGSVDNTLDGFPFVDEQTNEIYTLTFGDENTLFESRIASRHQNFTWTTSDSDLFAIQSNQDFTAQYNAGAIAEAENTGFISKSFEENLVTDFDFNNWTTDNNLGDWFESGGSVINKQSITTAPSSSNDFAVRFNTQDSFITQSFLVQNNSVYEIVAHASASDAGQGSIDLEISGSFGVKTIQNLCGGGEWFKTRDDFYTSGSATGTQTLKLTFTAVSASTNHKPLLDSVFFRRWEGSNFSDTSVTITGKYHDAGQSDGFNDHATRYNTAISKVVEIQDTYGGLSIACFLPGTQIQMSDGTTKLIENINVGDEVLSIDLPGLPDEDLGYSEWKSFTMRPMDNLPEMVQRNKNTAKVEHLFYDYMNGYYNINDGFLKVTKEHDLFVYHSGEWIWETPNNLLIGMKMFGYDGNVINIDSITWVDGEVEVINFDVEPLDVYFAGGVLVHNKGTSSDPS